MWKKTTLTASGSWSRGDHMTLTAPQLKGGLVDLWLGTGWCVSFPAPDRNRSQEAHSHTDPKDHLSHNHEDTGMAGKKREEKNPGP